MTPAQVMKRAANLLNEDAIAGKQSCMVGEKPWACPDCVKVDGKCNARFAHDLRVQTAASLIVMAEGM